jgi:hypothetical protein
MLFKRCPDCGNVWTARSEFIADPQLRLIGYQVNFRHLEEGFFLFEHTVRGCFTTLAVAAGHFRDLYDGPMFQAKMAGSPECPGFCLHKKTLKPCPNECECAYVRHILDIIHKWPKAKPASENKDKDIAS